MPHPPASVSLATQRRVEAAQEPVPARGPAACASVSLGSPVTLAPCTSLPLSRPSPRPEAPLPLSASEFQPSVILQLQSYLFSSPSPCPSVPCPVGLDAAGACPAPSWERPEDSAGPSPPGSPPTPAWKANPASLAPWGSGCGKEAACDIKSVDAEPEGGLGAPKLSMAFGVMYLVLLARFLM